MGVSRTENGDKTKHAYLFRVAVGKTAPPPTTGQPRPAHRRRRRTRSGASRPASRRRRGPGSHHSTMPPAMTRDSSPALAAASASAGPTKPIVAAPATAAPPKASRGRHGGRAVAAWRPPKAKAPTASSATSSGRRRFSHGKRPSKPTRQYATPRPPDENDADGRSAARCAARRATHVPKYVVHDGGTAKPTPAATAYERHATIQRGRRARSAMVFPSAARATGGPSSNGSASPRSQARGAARPAPSRRTRAPGGT